MSQPPDASWLPAPPTAPRGIRALFALRTATKRWPFAARAAVCMGAPVLTGWLAGDTAAGLTATLGSFTALYGGDRPYLNRAGHLAIIAVSFALALTLGVWAAPVVWAGVLVVALIAMAATLLCNALAVGPPGAYMFALACAAGTGMHGALPSPWRTGLLVLTGGAFAWLVHMSGALFWPRGPEKSKVAAAAGAVTTFIEALGTPRQETARHWAALALHDSWAALVSYRPVHPGPDDTLNQLRALNRELHLLFAEVMRACDEREPPAADAADRARRLTEAAQNPSGHGAVATADELSLGHPRPLELVRQAITPGSHSLLVVVRVGVAALGAGVIGAASSLAHASWAIATAVLVLHQGFDWVRTWHRGLHRVIGTWVGLVVAAGVLAAHPTGLWLVVTMMLLQFTIEMCVVRNYALAAVFITPAALIIASGGHPVTALGDLLLARGLDTAIGAAVALVVFVLLAERAVARRMIQAIGDTLDAVDAAVGHLAQATVITAQARTDRRDLQRRTIGLMQAYEAAVGGSAGRRRAAERMWPAVVATQRLAYRTLSACWAVERAGADGARERARSLFGADDDTRLHAALAVLVIAIRDGAKPPPIAELPPFLRSEVLTVHDSLVRGPD